MTNLSKNILLGITGGIAAYKSADLVRRLRENGMEVRVVMTKAAQHFVTALTFQALSGHPVLIDGENAESEFAMDHIAAARWADMVLVAPATADFMAKLAHGFADDLLSTLCLATTAPLILAPAMNQQMWLNPATQANKIQLLMRDVTLWGPAEGAQACGEHGAGRMLQPEEIALAVKAYSPISHGHSLNDVLPQILAKKCIVITAGPTQEPIDPVRYISNRSSGKMGYALAEAAQKLGAKVILVSGPTGLNCPQGVARISVVTASEMQKAVINVLPNCEMFIGAAAVADYACAAPALQKIKKQAENLTLNLVRNPDILASVAHTEKRPLIVGFAAETENVLANAQKKLHEKKLDLIVANDVSDPAIGFDSDCNAVTVLWNQDKKVFALQPKQQLAMELMRFFALKLKAAP